MGEKIGPLVTIGVPGKLPGEVAFYRPKRRLLMVGDAVIGHPPERLMLLRESVIEDVPRLRESVRKLLALDFDTLLTGDGQPILQGAKERLIALINTFPK